jgi:hypothetical protein
MYLTSVGLVLIEARLELKLGLEYCTLHNLNNYKMLTLYWVMYKIMYLTSVGFVLAEAEVEAELCPC